MATVAVPSPARDVINQSVPLEPFDHYTADVALDEAVARGDGGWGADRLSRLGALAGSAETREHGRRAERNEPRLSPTTASATASTRSSSTRRGTGCCGRRSSTSCTRCPGASRDPAPTSSAAR